jgi:hypothetical protein
MEIDGNNQVLQQGQEPVGARGANGVGGAVALQVGGQGANARLLELVMAVVAHLAAMQQFLRGVEDQHAQDHTFSANQYQGIAAGIRCIHQQPNQVLMNAAHNQNAIQQQFAQPAAATGALVAHGNINSNNTSLSLTPCFLFELWTEWTVRIGGQKPGKYFTVAEHRQKNSCCKVVCYCVIGGVRIDSSGCINQIYAMYSPGKSITNIINQLKENLCDGTLHPSLRVGM